MFRKRVDKSITKVDKIVTWLIIWGALASIFWVSKTSFGKRIYLKWVWIFKKTCGFWFSSLWRGLVKVIWIFKRKK